MPGKITVWPRLLTGNNSVTPCKSASTINCTSCVRFMIFLVFSRSSAARLTARFSRVYGSLSRYASLRMSTYPTLRVTGRPEWRQLFTPISPTAMTSTILRFRAASSITLGKGSSGAPNGSTPFVFQTVLDASGDLWPSEAFNQPEREVESGGNTAGRDDVACVNHTRMGQQRASSAQIGMRQMMGGRWSGIEQSRCGEQHGASANARDDHSCRVQFFERDGQRAALRLSACACWRGMIPSAAWDDHHIRFCPFAVVSAPEPTCGANPQAIESGDFRLAVECDELGCDVGAQLCGAPKRLIGGDGVQFVEALEQHDLYVHGKASCGRFGIKTTGTLAIDEEVWYHFQCCDERIRSSTLSEIV